MAAATLFVLAAGTPVGVFAADLGSARQRADLDGKAIALRDVSQWYCEDFDVAAIHCYSDPKALETRVASTLAATSSVTYVVVYEFPSFQGAYMYMSDNYSILATIGWNDRISSFSVRNSMSGVFWTDWFYSGSLYSFCCNSWVGSLGSYDNSFSSVYHN